MNEGKIIEGSTRFLCAAVELAMGRIDLCKCSACGSPRDNGRGCRECEEGYCDPVTEDCHTDAAIQAIKSYDTLTNRVAKLESVLCEISNMCMGYSLDADHIGQSILEGTGMSNPELNDSVKAKAVK